MNDSLARIHAVLDGFVRRRLGLLAGEALARALAAWCLGLAGLVLAASHVPLAAGRFVVIAIALAGIVAAAWDAGAWSAALSRRRHAERVEGLRPELRGQLLTVLDRSARPMGSPALVERMARQAAAVLVDTPAGRTWPLRPFRQRLLLALVSLALLGFVAREQDPLGLLARYWGGAAPLVSEAPTAEPVVPQAVLGDITLRYLYPVYTRLDPLEIPNSNGEVHAPPGTVVEVRARTAEVYREATLHAYGEGLPASLSERRVEGRFTVGSPGTWRFDFGGISSAEMKIVPEPDLAPDVSVQAPADRVKLAADDSFNLPYTARDDYGVTRVVVEVSQGGKKREVPLRSPADAPRLFGDQARLAPAALGLAAGERATLRVGAWDNDGIGGSKVGWSAPVELEVVGPKGTEEAAWAFRLAARDALVEVLADFLVDPVPPAATLESAAGWGAAADARYVAFDELVRATWLTLGPPKIDQTWMDELSRERRALVGFARGLAGSGPLGERDAATLDDLHARHTATLEHAILLLDQLLQAWALSRLNELVAQLAAEARELDADIAELSPAQAQARLDQLDRQFRQVAEAAAGLDEGSLKEFVTDRSDEVDALMESVREALRAGRTDEARQMMSRLSALLQEMAEGIKEMQERRGGRESGMQDAMKQLATQLEALEKEQRALRERTAEAREQFGGDMERAVETWERIQALAERVAAGLSDDDPLVRRLRMSDRGMDLALGDGAASAEGLRDSARARDADTARDRAENVAYDLDRVDNRREMVAGRPAAPPKADLDAIGKSARSMAKDLGEILRLLEQMRQDPAMASPELQQTLRRMAEEQQALNEGMEAAQDAAQRIAQQLPMSAPGLEEGAERAAGHGRDASEAMEGGDVMRAEGAERAAEDALREAQEALREAQRNLRAMQQAAAGEGEGERGGKGEDEGEGREGDGDGPNPTSEEVLLPAPEEFQTPEEYRKALLEGMGAEVPAAYEAAKRRYYEELVRQ